MRVLLTDRFCDRAKAQEGEAQTDYFDAKASGLALRVGRKKSWTFHFNRQGRRARLTFGAYPTISLAAARGRVLEIKADLAEGREPVASQAISPSGASATSSAVCAASTTGTRIMRRSDMRSRP